MAASPPPTPGHYNDYCALETTRNTLLIIDPQNDFHPGGSLAIPTANADAARISALLSAHGAEIDDIVVSLDTHQKLHIAHSLFWVNSAGEHPPPFTPIPVEAVQSGTWKTANPSFQDWGLQYVQALASNGRFTLLIWPDHCLIGSKGHAVVDDIAASLDAWCGLKTRAIEYILKGNNMLTEHYSALKADVERDDDQRTQFNAPMFARLRKADRVIICGQALSHCVAFSTRDLVERWPKNELSKLVLLTDCSSPVPSFEKAAEDFVADMVAAGVTVTTSDKLKW